METQQVKEPVAIFVAQPPARKPHITLAPEECGYGVNAKGEPAPFENVVFHDGRYTAFDEDIAEALRKHSGNVANRGDVFFEVEKGVVDHARQLSGMETAAMPEGGLTDDDRELLAKLEKGAAAKSLPPKAADALAASFHLAHKRFLVGGIKEPKPGDKPSKVIVRTADLLELLKANGISAEE